MNTSLFLDTTPGPDSGAHLGEYVMDRSARFGWSPKDATRLPGFLPAHCVPVETNDWQSR
jgi:hypothetical protein